MNFCSLSQTVAAFAFILAASPISCGAQEIVVSKIKPGKLEIPAIFVNQFEGRMSFLIRGKMKDNDTAFPEGVLKFNFRRTGQATSKTAADPAKAKEEGKGTEGVSRLLDSTALVAGKTYLLDLDISKVRIGDGAYPYFLDGKLQFADRAIEFVALNGESLTNDERKLAGIPESNTSPIKPLPDSERANLGEWAMQITNDPKVDTFKITDTVKMKNAPGTGANIVLDSFSPWKGNRMTNIWNRQATFEPTVFRHMNAVGSKSQGTADYLEHNYAGGYGGLSFWQTFPSSFWDGADLEIYRKKGEYYETIHKTKVKKWVAERDSEERIYFETPSPEPSAEGDIYLLTMERDSLPDCVQANQKNFQGLTPTPDTKLAIDRSTAAPEGGSTTSLKMTLPGGKDGGFSHHFAQDKQGWTKFSAGKKYVAEIWMKQEGLDNDEVTLALGHLGSQKMKVGKDWKKYSAIFDYKPEPEKISKLEISSKGAGSLWIDNFIVYEEGTPPFDLLPQYEKALAEWNPESLRFLNQGIVFYRTLDSTLQKGFSEKSSFVGKGKEGTSGPTTGTPLFYFLEASRKTGANPWINTFVFTDEECKNLIEYLAGPADSPYGKIRAEKHGQVKPWTDVFDKIYIEMGNECWNSPVFDPLSFAGKPERHAALSNKMYRAMRSSPYFSDAKIDLIAGGHSHNPSYTGALIKDGKESDMLAVANYIGGWDGFTVLGGDDRALFQRQLLYPAQVIEPQMEAIAAELKKYSRDQGDHSMKVGIYEFGPGYAIPSAAKPYTDESEEVGKSLALGIATLDMHMVWLNDFGFGGPQGFFNFQTGVNWASHTDGDSMRPFAAWQALELRNKFCKGDLMKVEPVSVKTVNLPDSLGMQINWKGEKKELRIAGRKNILMVRCFAFADGKNRSLLLINRMYDEPRTLKLDLPAAPEPNITIRSLAYHEPRATNRDELLYKIEESAKSDFASGYEITIPPCSATVINYQSK